MNLDSFINEGTGKLGDKNEGTMIWSIARIGKNLRNKGIVNNLAPTEQINMQTENDKTREMIRNFSYRLISTKGDVFKSNNNSFLSEIGIEKINFVRDEETNTINLTVEMIEEESETKPIFTISIEPDKLSIINNTDALRQDRLLFDNIILNLIHELTSQEYEYDESTGTIDSKGSGKTAHFRRLPYGHNPNPKAVEDIQKLTRKPYDEVLRLWTKQGRINMDLESLNYDPTGGDLTKYWKVTFVRESRISEVSHNSQYLQSLIR